MATVDPIELTRALVRCPSVTPAEGGALALLEERLAALGFACERVRFEAPGTDPVDNLWARLGEGRPHLAFAGHTDVVPPGDPARWTDDPFAGVLRDGRIWGRGTTDMKSGIACFVAAVAGHLERHGPPRGAISLLITGDEEGPAVNGTARLLEWAAGRGERWDAAIVGEPTCPAELGDMMKIGRRGSMTGRLVAIGRQGHTAYPHRAENAAHLVVAMLQALLAEPLDGGSELFEPSNLQVTSIDIGNPAGNVVPERAVATFNIRYNDRHDAASLERWLRERLDKAGGRYELEVRSSGDAFFTRPGPLSDMLGQAVEEVTGRRPELSTSGGTSDARFIKRYCPVVEFGLVGQSMHQVDENVALADIEGLTGVYQAFLWRFFAAA
ncbi:succinyl-diaminopimelate desuccinylase [Marinimicrococcus flavescens]|uniref:Succinyl-diaminopimelate desuccinylase n=1 Tax=Marinimicrococcus flavescens TaxID=3031815 RepID=A0AAP3UY23_9PROT|nr:succinyl-diaminopimelate desuccinylase [Marinimicrococcus flavescens]